MTLRAAVIFALVVSAVPVRADWPTLRGGPKRWGSTDAALPAGPQRLAWVRHFTNERISTAAEPIVGGGKVFVGTHAGSLYALDAVTGEPVWRVAMPGPLLHSPAYDDGRVVAADATGRLVIVDAAHGNLLAELKLDPAGFAASPLVARGLAIIGSRGGELYAVDLATGAVRWKASLGAPIRQSATFGGQSGVFVTGEDMRVRRVDVGDGAVTWTSEQLSGQTARDYYPVVTVVDGRGMVVVRTNPAVQFSQRLQRDREFLCRTAGLAGAGSKEVEAWVADERSLGTPADLEREQAAIEQYLKDEPAAQTFFVLDASTGKAVQTPPVLWVGGCQGVGTPPVVAPDGRMLVQYRTAHGNWNRGVAPLVSLGMYDLKTNRIEPMRHAQGMSPPWNTFWGTADESQNFVWAGRGLVIVHQSTLSTFDPTTQQLSPLFGERDSFGGFRNLPWARNEWNGPARGGVAVDGGRAYWLTGSRLLCLESGPGGKAVASADVGVDAAKVPTTGAPAPDVPSSAVLKSELARAVDQVLDRPWAPLYVEPGLAGREFFFDDSGELFRALAAAYPRLPEPLQARVRARLAREWDEHPPFDARTWYATNVGERRERFAPAKGSLARPDPSERPPFHPFGNVYAVWLYAERCGEWERVHRARAALRAAFDDFVKTGWRLDPGKGDLHANRYLASLIAYQRLAERAGDADSARQAAALVTRNSAALVAWWSDAAARAGAPVLNDIKELDHFIGGGDALFVAAAPHRAKLALLHDLTPEVAEIVRKGAGDAPDRVWATFTALCPTWHLVGEERQVHYGENLYDPPDFAADGFLALAWLRQGESAELRARVDVPWGSADLFHVLKLATALER